MQRFLVGCSPGLYRTYQGNLFAHWKWTVLLYTSHCRTPQNPLDTRGEIGKRLIGRLALVNHDGYSSHELTNVSGLHDRIQGSMITLRSGRSCGLTCVLSTCCDFLEQGLLQWRLNTYNWSLQMCHRQSNLMCQCQRNSKSETDINKKLLLKSSTTFSDHGRSSKTSFFYLNSFWYYVELAHGYCLAERVFTTDKASKSCCPIVSPPVYHASGKLTYFSVWCKESPLVGS